MLDMPSPNLYMRSLLAEARQYVHDIGRIPYDHAVRLMQAGYGDVNLLEENLRREFGH